MERPIAIRARSIITPLARIEPGVVLIEGERIAEVGTTKEVEIPAGCQVIDAPDKTVVPGFIDTHIHGWGGTHFGQSVETTIAMCQSIASTGTTGLLPTLMTEPTFDEILDNIRVVRQAMLQGTDGAQILGIHMEGPYLSTEDTARGSQEAAYLRKPSLNELLRLVEVSEGSIRKMTIAPELGGAMRLIRELAGQGIVPSAGHSTATYEQALEAVAAGLSCATHTFNGMLPLHHRRPGLLGAVLTNDVIRAEVIADGEHVSPPAMELLVRCKGVESVHIVTDSTLWAGLPDGRYPARGGRTVIKEGTRACVEGGTLFGSVAPMNFAVSYLARSTHCTLAEAVRLATLNPARVIGFDDRKGRLAPGKDADMVIVDEEVNVYLTMAGGRTIYRADGWEVGHSQ